MNKVIKFIMANYPYFNPRYPERKPSKDLTDRVKAYLKIKEK